ncbi:TPA: type II secretion system protein GspD [Candidatus Berkelbacteria bacterium]|uniref:Type II and III secretion system protein, type IV pilus assembly protein PilQ n=1 Tax=Berkelbacteria bacterium GW2011_GWE1_39_12 TaxID=1618337 RepID=A0A0G4B5R3_9BACT|nr:MAG: type II and III secretion system protein, type IV pilus assembly protein PilQ [Berkelbacteria bacterium GW2011_GWE1_39_12]HBO60186.1 type II secretion system protein GspD [Candidatus Berkelbacteria bacterium]
MKRLILCSIALLCLFFGSSVVNADPATKITNVFQDTDIRQALVTIAVQAGENVVPDSSVGNMTVTLDLKDAPFEVVLQMICDSGGYSFIKDEHCYLVGQAVPTNPNFDRFCTSEAVKLKNSEACEMVKVFNQFYAQYVKAGGTRENVIVISAPQRISQAIKKIIQEIDQPKRQIEIEVMAVEIQKVKGRDFMLDWTEGRPGVSGGIETLSFANFVFGYTNTLSKNVLIGLKSALQNGVARVRANPRITTMDGYEALFSSGQEDYFDTSSQNPNGWQTGKLEKIESGVKLKILPRLAENGEINLCITPDVSDVIGKTEQGLPRLNVRTMTTTLRVKDGETIVMGGMLSEISRSSKKKLPILGDLPLIGFAFRSNSTSAIVTDMAILVTPRIVNDLTTRTSVEANSDLLEAVGERR